MSFSGPYFQDGGRDDAARRALLAALSPGASDLELLALRDHGNALYLLLGSGDGQALMESHMDGLTPKILLAIYSAMSGPEQPSYADGTEDPYRAAVDLEERAAYEAFERVLIPALPERIGDPASGEFGALQLVPDKVRDLLLEHPCMRDAGLRTKKLASYGITPVKFLRATQAVSSAAKRRWRSGGAEDGAKIVFNGFDLRDPGKSALARSEVVEEIVATAAMSVETAGCILNWMSRLAHSLPALFVGFHVLCGGPEMVLVKTDHIEEDLSVRWRPSPSGEL